MMLFFILAVLVSVVLIKYKWIVQVNKPIESSQGIVQRAAAFDKLIYQVGSLDAQIPAKFIAKNNFHQWLTSLSSRETKFAIEFINYSVDIYDRLNSERVICGDLKHDYENGLDSDEIKIAQILSYELKGYKAKDTEASNYLIEKILIDRFSCKKSIKSDLYLKINTRLIELSMADL